METCTDISKSNNKQRMRVALGLLLAGYVLLGIYSAFLQCQMLPKALSVEHDNMLHNVLLMKHENNKKLVHNEIRVDMNRGDTGYDKVLEAAIALSSTDKDSASTDFDMVTFTSDDAARTTSAELPPQLELGYTEALRPIALCGNGVSTSDCMHAVQSLMEQQARRLNKTTNTRAAARQTLQVSFSGCVGSGHLNSQKSDLTSSAIHYIQEYLQLSVSPLVPALYHIADIDVYSACPVASNTVTRRDHDTPVVIEMSADSHKDMHTIVLSASLANVTDITMNLLRKELRSHIRNAVSLPELPSALVYDTDNNMKLSWSEGIGKRMLGAIHPWEVLWLRMQQLQTVQHLTAETLIATSSIVRAAVDAPIGAEHGVTIRVSSQVHANYATACKELEMSLAGTHIVDEEVGACDVRDGLHDMSFGKRYKLAQSALRHADELSTDPTLLPVTHFPLEQVMSVYAPYWIPVLIPLIKAFRAVR
jgi:hypothetical protein